MSSYGLPRPIREELDKAFGFLERDNLEKAVRCAARALRAIANASSEQQKLAEERVRAFLTAFSSKESVRQLLLSSSASGSTYIPYRLGQEGQLAVVLDGLVKILSEQQVLEREVQDFAESYKRQNYLWQTGQAYLAEGQVLLAAAFFK
ncbi:MAG: hypothetical protein IJS50_03150, partial [Desulfovibrio sp.]|nr:hypothetical protein [Desulfovibrio sp.]